MSFEASSPGDVPGFGDDSDGGAMGWDPLVIFTVDQSATYIAGVFDQTGVGPGGYLLPVSAG